MRIIGFSTGATGKNGNVDRLVKAVMTRSGHAYEFVKLTDLTYSGCKGCVHLCAQPQVCILQDDLLPHYAQIVDADAVVVGSPVYFGSINAQAISFIERFFGYRHVSVAIEGKPFVLVGAGSMGVKRVEKSFRQWLRPFRVDVLDCVTFRSAMPPCLTCGRHKACNIGGLHYMHGEAVHEMDITAEMFTAWENDPATVAAVDAAAAKLRDLEAVSGETEPTQ
jgi:multimeric flavodoxin WrbA